LLVLVLTFMSLTFSNEGFCLSESASYEALITANCSGVILGATSSYDIIGLSGQPLIGPVTATGGVGVDIGFLYVLEPGLPGAPQEYDIYNIKAFSYATKLEIPEVIWQTKDDPYFTWSIRLTYPITLILGYSVSLDIEPNEIVDTTTPYYNGFMATPISDGKHTFYVKAATTGGTWGPTSSFEFWVDTKAPSATNLDPASGLIIIDNKYPISLDLSDSHSGIDIDTIKLYIDNGSLSFDYDNGHLSATPLSAFSDGRVTANIQAKDFAGNQLNLAWGFIVDANDPIGSIIINGDEESTTYARVRLNLIASDDTTEVTQMIISNDGIFDTEAWEDFQALRTDWVLDEPQEAGIKIVYCMFRDEAGNISSIYSDEIRLLSAAIDTIITTGPYSPTKDTSAQFNYQSTFEDALFSYRLDTGEWSDWSLTTEISFSDLSVDNHIFSVKSARDLNEDEEITEEEEDPLPAQWTWIITTEEVVEEKERVLYWRTE